MTKEARSRKSEVRSWKLGVCVLAVAEAMSGPVWGQGTGDTVVVPRSALAPLVLPEWPKRDEGKLTLSGQKLEKPDLQYQLLPRVADTTEGNGAVLYLQGAAKLPAMPAAGETIVSDVARNAALEALDGNDARLKAALAEFEPALKFLHDGSRMTRADWQTPIRTEAFTAQLPQLGQLRWLSRALVVKTRLAIKAHRWREAQEDLQTGYALARHLGEGDTLIESLVGIAIAGSMNRCLQDWVGEPGSPNLYWPLSNLPVPFNDMRRPMATERDFVWFGVPLFKHARAGQFSVADWNEAIGSMRMLGSGNFEVDASKVPAVQKQVLGTAAAVAMYPQAKAYLKERGVAAEAVEKMAVVEAVSRYFVGSFDESQDDMLKWMGLPPAERMAGLKQWEATFEAQRAANQTNILAAMMLPALGKIARTAVKMDREIAALRVVEAIRVYAGEKGKLPGSLEELTLPVPVDPLGKGFVYRQTGEMAVLSSPEEVEAGDAVRYEVTLRK